MGWVCAAAFGCGAALPQAWTDFLLPHHSSSKHIKGWCYLSFLLPSVLKNIKEKERCVLLSCPAAASDVPKLSPSKSKGSQSRCSSSLTTAKLCACLDTPGRSSARLSPSHSLAAPTPAFILLMQIYEKLHICRELHYAGDVITAVPALHEE